MQRKQLLGIKRPRGVDASGHAVSADRSLAADKDAA